MNEEEKEKEMDLSKEELLYRKTNFNLTRCELYIDKLNDKIKEVEKIIEKGEIMNIPIKWKHKYKELNYKVDNLALVVSETKNEIKSTNVFLKESLEILQKNWKLYIDDYIKWKENEINNLLELKLYKLYNKMEKSVYNKEIKNKGAKK